MEGTARIANETSTHKKTTAWFSPRCPSLAQARDAISLMPAIALPCSPPSGPRDDEVKLLRDMRACDERVAVGRWA
jgi:hypothetical protein